MKVGYRQRVKNSPIGIFDSGLGGLTVARAVIDALPNEDILYLGDTANTPYGPRPQEEVREMALNSLDYLVGEGVKMVVIACNTATAAAYQDAKKRYEDALGIPVVEVVTPASRVAEGQTTNGTVGIIGTTGTVESGIYPHTLQSAVDVEVHQSAAPKFVEYVESGVVDGPELFEVACEYLQPLKDAGVDTLVLGCTHYPLLEGVIGEVMGEDTTLVSSSVATASEVAKILEERKLLRGPRKPGSKAKHFFLSTGIDKTFEVLSRRFLGPEATDFQAVKV